MAAPANDNWANAQVLSSITDQTVSGTTIDATLETGEAVVASINNNKYPVYHTVWYTVVAPMDGYVAVTLPTWDNNYPSDYWFRPLFVIFDGSGTSVTAPGVQLSAGDPNGAPHVSVTSGQTYQICVGSYTDVSTYGYNPTGNYTLNVNFRLAAANDNWANKQVLPSVVHQTVTVVLDGATVESGEVWAGASVTTTVAASSNGVDTATFTGSQSLYVASTTGFPYYNYLSVQTAGTTALIYYYYPEGTYFYYCKTLSGGGVLATGDTVECDLFFHSVWYSIVAPLTGYMEVTGTISYYFGIFDGSGTSAASPGVLLNSITNYAPVIPVVSGNTYVLAKAIPYRDVTSDVTMDLLFGVPPVNDNFVDAIALTGTSGQLTNQNNQFATMETGEPYTQSGNVNTIWYTLTPSEDLIVNIDTFGSTLTDGVTQMDTCLDVFTGSNVAGLTLVVQNNDAAIAGHPRTSALAFLGRAGVIYHIRVEGYYQSNHIIVNWSQVAPASLRTMEIMDSGDSLVVSVLAEYGIVVDTAPINIGRYDIYTGVRDQLTGIDYVVDQYSETIATVGPAPDRVENNSWWLNNYYGNYFSSQIVGIGVWGTHLWVIGDYHDGTTGNIIGNIVGIDLASGTADVYYAGALVYPYVGAISALNGKVAYYFDWPGRNVNNGMNDVPLIHRFDLDASVSMSDVTFSPPLGQGQGFYLNYQLPFVVNSAGVMVFARYDYNTRTSYLDVYYANGSLYATRTILSTGSSGGYLYNFCFDWSEQYLLVTVGANTSYNYSGLATLKIPVFSTVTPIDCVTKRIWDYPDLVRSSSDVTWAGVTTGPTNIAVDPLGPQRVRRGTAAPVVVLPIPVPVLPVDGFSSYGGATAVAASSNGVDTATFTGSGVLNVVSTAMFRAPGTLTVTTAGTSAIITFTGVTGTSSSAFAAPLRGTTMSSFTGVTTVSGGGVLATGGAIVGTTSRWSIYDQATNELGVFFRNPLSGGEVGYSKRNRFAQVQVDGPELEYEQNELATGAINGYVLSDDDWRFFQSWMNHTGPVILTDDLGGQTLILIQTFEPSRIRKASNDMYHTFKMTYLIVQVLQEV